MSKLKELFESSQYARLNNIAGGDKTFSVRNQSNTEQSVRQSNAVDFFPNTYQDGFDVNKESLSAQGFAKSPAQQTSDFTGDADGQATTQNTAFDSYNRFANDPIRSRYESKLVHKYLATNSDEQYKTKQAAAPGLILTYNV